jgi:hypothetical protein
MSAEPDDSTAAVAIQSTRNVMAFDSGIIDPRSPRTLVRRDALLDRFTEDVAGTRGVDVRMLEPLTAVTVRTRNSTYELIANGGTSMIVRGGRFFPDATRARLEGSGFGGTMLKMAWIAVGLRMEIFANGQRIITSPVRDITVEPSTTATTH